VNHLLKRITQLLNVGPSPEDSEPPYLERFLRTISS
jgi:hypothetical protein